MSVCRRGLNAGESNDLRKFGGTQTCRYDREGTKGVIADGVGGFPIFLQILVKMFGPGFGQKSFKIVGFWTSSDSLGHGAMAP